MAVGDSVMDYIIGGTLALLVLFSLTPSVLQQYEVLGNETVSGGTQTYFEAAPVGVEAAVGATVIIFFVLVVYNMYKNA